ncbi:MAG: hypothetical protein KGN84_02155, partial [Acidobacteriota bacterium]|nr:hypothetical protein [Acidobacteriota bacterium]
DEALEWAEKGLKAFPSRPDFRLHEFAAGEYHRRGRHQDAMKLIWAEFCERLYLEAWKTLRRHATEAGAWPEWRERALAEIRSRIAKTRAQRTGQKVPLWQRDGSDNSLLVEIFLDEQRVEDAWSEAQSGGCSGSLWLALAAKREAQHPVDAAPIYLKYAEAGVTATTNGRYEDAVKLLIKAAAVMRGMGRSAEFAQQLNALCTKYRIKRNFVKLVEQNRPELYRP